MSEQLWEDLMPLQRSQYLMETEPDCTFVVGSKKFRAHKWILSEVSPVFERMFNGHFREAKSSDEITLTDEDPDVFSKFLYWIYHDKVSSFVTVENAPLDTIIALYNIANKYLVVKPFMEKCFKGIKASFNSCVDYDLLRSFEFVHLINYDNCHNRKIALIDDIKKELQLRLEQTDSYMMQCTNFYDWDSEIFLDFIRSLGKYITQAVLFQTIEIYAKVNRLFRFEDFAEMGKATPHRTIDVFRPPDCTLPVGKCATLEQMLSCVDYSKMSLKEFLNGPAKSKLLSKLEKDDIVTLVPIEKTMPPNKRNYFRSHDYKFRNSKHRTYDEKFFYSPMSPTYTPPSPKYSPSSPTYLPAYGRLE